MKPHPWRPFDYDQRDPGIEKYCRTCYGIAPHTGPDAPIHTTLYWPIRIARLRLQIAQAQAEIDELSALNVEESR